MICMSVFKLTYYYYLFMQLICIYIYPHIYTFFFTLFCPVSPSSSWNHFPSALRIPFRFPSGPVWWLILLVLIILKMCLFHFYDWKIFSLCIEFYVGIYFLSAFWRYSIFCQFSLFWLKKLAGQSYCCSFEGNCFFSSLMTVMTVPLSLWFFL